MSADASDRIRIEDLLDSVADAVSALVMFASESKNDRRLLTSLRTGVTAVTEAVNFLVGEATVTVKLWREFGNTVIADEMQQCNDGIRTAANDVEESVKTLASQLDDADAKATLLDAGKGIMKFMVRLLQLNDLYEVTVILKQIQLLRELMKERDSKTFAFDEFGMLLGLLGDLLSRRLLSVHDTKVRTMMQDATSELGKITQPLRDTLEEFQSSYDPSSVKSRREVLISTLNLTLKKAYEATKLSAKSPFDLSMLDKEFDDFGDLEEVVNVRGLDDSLDALAEAIRNGDENAMESILRRMKKELESQLEAAEEAANSTSDPNLRAKLLAAVDGLRSRLNDMMEQLGAAARDALHKRDPELLKALIAEIKKASAQLLEGPAKDQMLQRAANIESLLRSLQKAVANKDGLEAVAVVRDIAGEIDDAGDLARTLAQNITDDPFRADRLLTTASGLDGEKDELGLATSAALRGLSPETLARLQASMQRVRDGMNSLVSASLMTSPQEMVDNAAQIEKALQGVELSGHTAKKNPAAVTNSVSVVVSKVKPQLELALAYAEKQDAETKRGVSEATDALKQATANLVTVARGVVADASDPKVDLATLQRRLQDAIDRARKANMGLVEAATDAADEEIKGLVAKLRGDVAKMRDAASTGDVETAAAGMAETKDNTKRLAILARISADGMEDMDLKHALLKLSGDLGEGLMEKLIPAMKAALADPSNSKKQAELNALFERLLSLASEVEKISGEASPEDKMAQNAKRMNKIADRESSQVVSGNSAEAAASLKEIRSLLLRHRQLANAVVERCSHDPSVADELMEAVAELEELYKGVIVATKADGSKSAASQRVDTPKAVEAFKKQSTKTGDLALGVRIKRKEAERRAAEEAERKRKEALAAEEDLTGKDEVFKAGHRVAQAVHKIELDEADLTPPAMLARAARKLADAMKQLSELSKTGSTSEIILLAREIASFVSDIVKWANKCAEECSDPLMAAELRDSAAVAKNFSIQLKIICAVKAGTSADDPTTKKSLVICAQGLSKNVVNTVNVSQVAKLKKKLKG
eukprot:TRINITY_DN2874_c0_g1_i1.p1 TRINITY_DN2874_c0_g1~~TRINITY_DN2874_c0_g1_i1.p1  ORF type:complete len:1071 (-),score=258.53 TRINITY_DN2874_c0_g1_i1:58-3219(-)